MSQNSQENTCARVSFLIKLQAWDNFIKKEIQAQMFSCKFYEIFKNTFFYKTPHLVAASEFWEKCDIPGYIEPRKPKYQSIWKNMTNQMFLEKSLINEFWNWIKWEYFASIISIIQIY